ncbi:MAG: hypothetical protein WC417_02490 [Candidatus Omnitrophota bacterium]|jgi:hypothetical protein
MKMKWLFILAAVLIAVMLLSLFFVQVSTKILPSPEEENKLPGQPPVLSEPQAATPPLFSPAPISRAVHIISKPEQNVGKKVENAPQITEPYSSSGSANAPAASVSTTAAATEGPALKAGITKEGKEATPAEIVKIKARGIIIL